MLTCYGHRVRLPQNDLAYLAFRLALQETLSDIELYLDLEEEPDPPAGYLTEVPFLEQTPLPVPVDLLADAWDRHCKPDLIEASFLDAAVVYAACMTASHIIDDMPDVAVVMLRDGPRKVDPRIIRRASVRLEEMFDRFWDDRDFLLIEEFQDLPPDHAQRIKDLLRLPDEVVEEMPQPTTAMVSDGHIDLAERIQRAQTKGLEDGTRIEARGGGWVVIDTLFSFLLDPADASWVVGEDNEDMPPTVFPTAEKAYEAWEQSKAVAAIRKRRREEALKRLEKS